MFWGIAQTLFYCTQQHTNIFKNIDRTNGEILIMTSKMKTNREDVELDHNKMFTLAITCRLQFITPIN